MLKIVRNDEEGTQAEITVHEKGFAVGLRDNDSGIKLPQIRIFPVYVDAVAYAYRIANVRIRVFSQKAAQEGARTYTLDFTKREGEAMGFHTQGCIWVRGVGEAGAWSSDKQFALGVAAACGQEIVPIESAMAAMNEGGR